MGGAVQSANSGQYVVYADHSRTGVGTSLNDSSASPRATMTMFRGQKLAGLSLHVAHPSTRTTTGTATRPPVLIIRAPRVRDPLEFLPHDIRSALPVAAPCEATFEWLADHAPTSLAALIDAGTLSVADLTFAAEAMGRISDAALVRATLVKLLGHPSAVIREGALYGLMNHLDDGVRALLLRLASEDPSPAVRDIARDAHERT